MKFRNFVWTATLAAMLCGCGGGGSGNGVSGNSIAPTAVSATPAPPIVSPTPSGKPQQPPNIADDFTANKFPLQYAWNTFLAINWPASTDRGVPDALANLDHDAITTWETFKQSGEVYQANGATPLAWSALPPPVGKTGDGTRLLKQANPAMFASLIPNGGGVHLKDVNGNLILEEVRFNKTVFDFVVDHQLYNTDGQAAARAASMAPLSFPPNDVSNDISVEIKATWTVLLPTETALMSRYHTATAFRQVGTNPDGTPLLQKVTVGLVGLHISVRLASMPNWFWTTFEHVDNPLRIPDAFAYPQVAESAATVAMNDRMQKVLDGTVWRFYKSRGVQPGTFVDGDGNPTRLSNATLETAFQETASCITCHHIATLGPRDKDGNTTFLPFFLFPNGPDQPPQGHIGFLPTDFFPPNFKQTDFVWSLLEASPKQ